jgi:epoxyqueuosine reductase
MDFCPTAAIVGPYRVDARRCISYLTIELRTAIPVELRPLLGNRIFGCDDCQAVCPWNRFAQYSQEDDFRPRNGLDAADLVELFSWSEQEFLERTEGSAIRRIGHSIWLRNIAVALGNALRSTVSAMAGHNSEDNPDSQRMSAHCSRAWRPFRVARARVGPAAGWRLKRQMPTAGSCDILRIPAAGFRRPGLGGNLNRDRWEPITSPSIHA